MSRRSQGAKRRPTALKPGGEALEGRRLLTSGWPSYLSAAELRSLLNEPLGYPAVRPNTPVLPFGAAARDATYIDPSVGVTNGYAVILGTGSFVGPFAKLNASDGVVKIGGGSAILDNASITANPTHAKGPDVPEVRIGDGVQVGYGATITGPSAVGAYGAAYKPTSIGAGAVIDGAVIEPGAFVSPQARVGPGVTVPSGMKVLPGADVTTQAEAADPALGKVAPVTAEDVAELGRTLTANLQLGTGYVTLYQGVSATGISPAVPRTQSGVFNGNLSNVLGSNVQPGPPTSYLPPGTAPKYPTPRRGLAQGVLVGFPARATGNASFLQRPHDVARGVGRRNAIRADQGQPITIGSIASTGYGVTINAPYGGSLAIGQRLVAGEGAVILGGAAGTRSVLGDDVTVGPGAVLRGSSLGSGSTVGPNAYLVNSSFPDGTVIPAGAIYVNNAPSGQVNR